MPAKKKADKHDKKHKDDKHDKKHKEEEVVVPVVPPQEQVFVDEKLVLMIYGYADMDVVLGGQRVNMMLAKTLKKVVTHIAFPGSLANPGNAFPTVPGWYDNLKSFPYMVKLDLDGACLLLLPLSRSTAPSSRFVGNPSRLTTGQQNSWPLR
jgi:hypothetical protein